MQAEALGLDPTATLATLLAYPFRLIRLGAYWNRTQDGPGRFDTGELDRQVDAAERAGKQPPRIKPVEHRVQPDVLLGRQVEVERGLLEDDAESNEEISKKIYVSPSTAKTHANRAMTKLGARDRAQLVVFA